jgi:cytochrome-b5 reductase
LVIVAIMLRARAAAALARPAARLRAQPSVFHSARRSFAADAPAAEKKSSNLPFYLMGAGVAGLGLYWYQWGVVPSPTLSETKQEKSPLDPENFKPFTLKTIKPYNHNTAEFVFELPDNEASLLPVASCLVIKSTDPEALKDPKSGKPIIRPYTPISPSDHKGELVLLIKKYDNGNASKYIHNMKVGETLDIKGPISKYPWKRMFT